MFQRVHFLRALTGLGVSPLEDEFAALAAAHAHPSRHYHNQTHVSECLAHLGSAVHLAHAVEEIEIAIWFHDAVYDTRRSDNEARSAAWADRFLTRQGATEDQVERVVTMILATRSHQAETADARLMLDIDLGILGQPVEVFEAYDQAIRKEYHWLSHAQYRSGRVRVLKGFLDRAVIYQTESFAQRFEKAARDNIAAKIAELSG